MIFLVPLRGGIYAPTDGPPRESLQADRPYLFDADSHVDCRGIWCPRADVLILHIPIPDPGEPS